MPEINRYPTMDWPPYQYRPYPKYVKTPDGRELIVQSEAEHRALVLEAPEKSPEVKAEIAAAKRVGRPTNAMIAAKKAADTSVTTEPRQVEVKAAETPAGGE